MDDPYLIFPELVWENILSNLEDSNDILNVFKAYPQKLQGRVLPNSLSWLLDQVIPFLFPKYLSKKDLLSCRQVSSRWLHAIDNFLDNHPNHRPYIPEAPITGQLYIPSATPGYYLLEEHLPTLSFDSRESIDSFLDKTSDYLVANQKSFRRNFNPFLSRAIRLEMEEEDDDHELLNWFLNIITLFEKFGKEIWFLQYFDLALVSQKNELLQFLSLSLKLLPNLKSLDLAINMEHMSWNKPLKEFRQKFGKKMNMKTLPNQQLETLKVDCFFVRPLFARYYLMSYGNQLKRLDMDLKFWRKEFQTQFPNLRELMLRTGIWLHKSWIGKKLIQALEIKAEELHSLDIVLESAGGHSKRDFEDSIVFNDVMKSLVKFKKLSNFRFMMECDECRILALRETRGNENDSDDWEDNEIPIPNMKTFLVTAGGQLTYQFLRRFPSLEILEICDLNEHNEDNHYYSCSSRTMEMSETEPGTEKIKIAEYLNDKQMYKSNVWEVLPKLTTIALYGKKEEVGDEKWDFPQWNFTREKYEWRKMRRKCLSNVKKNCDDE